MENTLQFENDKYYFNSCSNIYRTIDGKNIFYLDLDGRPVWLSFNTPIHIELKEHQIIENLYP